MYPTKLFQQRIGAINNSFSIENLKQHQGKIQFRTTSALTQSVHPAFLNYPHRIFIDFTS